MKKTSGLFFFWNGEKKPVFVEKKVSPKSWMGEKKSLQLNNVKETIQSKICMSGHELSRFSLKYD